MHSKNSSTTNIVKLCNNPVKQYAWGSSNIDCCVSKLCKNSHFKNYAQLWMGVHPNGQSQVQINLQVENLSSNKCIKLSQFMEKHNYKSLQFLLKILSIQKCLSLQVHPNKQQAVQFHKNRPGLYADDNDKPEMFYTLTQFECFIGYLNQSQFKRIRQMKIFTQYTKQKIISNPKQMILFILNMNEQFQIQIVKQAIKNLSLIHPSRYDQTKRNQRKIWKILDDFPNDIGIVVSFFLDYKILQPGECYFLQCNSPHAYIHGQCIEILKNSDNVCRLGLTPKYKDLQIVEKVLGQNFNQFMPIKPVKIHQQNQGVLLFSQNALNLLIIKSYNKEHTKQKIKTADQLKIGIVIEGNFNIHQDKEMITFAEGEVFLIKNQTCFQVSSSQKNGLMCIAWSQY